MRVVMFYHSLVSDWNHGNAHFLRGVASELLARGHQVKVYEPHGGWSLRNLLADQGHRPLAEFSLTFPRLRTHFYDLAVDDVNELADGADLIIAHEWNDHELVRRLGALRRANPRMRLLFHDTHHRSVTDRAGISDYDLRHFDGVLAFGNIIRDLYLERGWAARAWTWHEAADTRIFYPRACPEREGDLVWVGNWGDGERSAELWEHLIQPTAELRIRTCVHGVRYPAEACQQLQEAGIAYHGWIPNYRVPEVFALHRVTVHIPRRPYVRALPGIPTIRPFEALACGIPLVSVPWEDSDGLFRRGEDYLVARDGHAMKCHLRDLLADQGMAKELADRGRETILRRHTCAHRVDELLDICRDLRMSPATLKEQDHETTPEHCLLRF